MGIRLAQTRVGITTLTLAFAVACLLSSVLYIPVTAEVQERVIDSGIADSTGSQGKKWRKTAFTALSTGQATVNLTWTGNADMKLNVFQGSTKLNGNTSTANPKSVNVSLTEGVSYDAVYWAYSGVGNYTLSIAEDVTGTPETPDPPTDPLTVVNISSTVETTPVSHSGDTADDPAIWVNPLDPALSLVIGNDKKGALETYDLSGNRVQRITSSTTFWGNVDVRGNYVTAANGGIRIFQVDPTTRQLAPAAEASSGKISTSGEGLCMYDPGRPGVEDGLYVYTIVRGDGRVRQYQLTDQDLDQNLAGNLVRDFTIGTEAEGCVANDQTGDLFIAEEDVALWRYGANAADGTTRTMVAPVNAALPADAEGVTLAGGYLFVSAQNVAMPNQNWVNVYTDTAPYQHVKSFRVVAGSTSDDCDRTDGITAFAGNLGAAFPNGMFICQDGNNGPPGTNGNQNFKYVPFETLNLQ